MERISELDVGTSKSKMKAQRDMNAPWKSTKSDHDGCSSPVVVRVVMRVGAHHHPWVVGTRGRCGGSSERSSSLMEGGGGELSLLSPGVDRNDRYGVFLVSLSTWHARTDCWCAM